MPIPCAKVLNGSLPALFPAATVDGSIGCGTAPTYSFTLKNCCADCTGVPQDEHTLSIVIISGLQVGDLFNGHSNGVYHGCSKSGVVAPRFNRTVTSSTYGASGPINFSSNTLKYFRSSNAFAFPNVAKGTAGIVQDCTRVNNNIPAIRSLKVNARKFVFYHYLKAVIFPGFTQYFSITQKWSKTTVNFPSWKVYQPSVYDRLGVDAGSRRSYFRQFSNTGTPVTNIWGPNQAGPCTSNKIINGTNGTPTAFPLWVAPAVLPIDVAGAFKWSTQAAILQTANVKYYSDVLAAISTATITINKIKRMPNAKTNTATFTSSDWFNCKVEPMCPGYFAPCATTNSTTVWHNC